MLPMPTTAMRIAYRAICDVASGALWSGINVEAVRAAVAIARDLPRANAPAREEATTAQGSQPVQAQGLWSCAARSGGENGGRELPLDRAASCAAARPTRHRLRFRLVSCATSRAPSIKSTLSTAITAKKELIPSLLTLALNDAMTYDKATKSGGPNGSIRLRPENSGLSSALDLLVEAKKEIDSYSKGGPISFADLIQFAAQSALKLTFLDAAIAKCGGNEEKGRTLYSAYGSNGQWGLFDKLFGRQDAQEPDPEGRVPDWSKASVQEMKDKFIAVGLGPRQLAVMSAFLGPDQAATEERLIADKDCRPWVEKYQRSRETVSRTDYEVDLITTLTKLSSLGQKINYEAYTYPKQKIDLGKLKL
ncbi:hypothetical protein E2562_014870 [Oryza meyeriana var. granulata]|uniref:Plant heme peroxidase family profile domain-containing protein n=1 Tax=Oryza meyeriana var. granulata TaxID=110450 RepID=A0A6G1BWC4_9ORYZ|nr:hypothetical protein E2562_014870 [Oryza meyeriana var. granulata]